MALTPKQSALIEKYEKITGEDIVPVKSLSFYSSVDAYMGVPYKFGGTTKAGMDCSGYVFVVYKEAFNVTLPRTSQKQFEACKKIGKHKLKEGNLVFFNFEHQKKVTHVGVYLGGGKFAHASTSKGVRVDDLESDFYKEHFLDAGRVN